MRSLSGTMALVSGVAAIIMATTPRSLPAEEEQANYCHYTPQSYPSACTLINGSGAWMGCQAPDMGSANEEGKKSYAWAAD